MKHSISKDFDFCYGHRVWTQTLNGEYSDNLKTSCRHLHGHQARVTVTLTADQLTAGMVTDFRHLEWLKRWLDSWVDHRFVLDRSDPLFQRLVGPADLHPVLVPGRDVVAGWVPEVADSLTGPEQELLGGFLIVDFVPTSENLSAWLLRLVQAKMSNLGVTVESITWWETTRSQSTTWLA